MSKNIEITDNLYSRIKFLADKKNMKMTDLLDSLVENIYDVNEEKLLVDNFEKFSNILIEDTGLFNYKGGQSGIYNRLKNSNVNTLQELFQRHTLNRLNYGENKLGDNNYIHNEMAGIINLLQYKYLNVESNELNDCLNTTINAHYTIITSRYATGYPGNIFKEVLRNGYSVSVAYDAVNDLFRLLKSCGFNLTCSKALIDYAFVKKIKNETLGEFLVNVNVNEIETYFSKVPSDYILFLNIYNVLTDYYKNIVCKEIKVK